jgi:hypothetical protein
MAAMGATKPWTARRCRPGRPSVGGAGWLPGLADIGWSNRLGWDEGLHRLMAVKPRGVITGFGVGAARAKDQPLAETFLALQWQPHPPYLSVGKPALGPYVSDQGFEGRAAHAR